MMGGGGPPSEEITTVFIVGFPDDMTEREFANMFLFARGFEASTLKIPAGGLPGGPGSQGGPGHRPENGPLSGGPGGPYNAVNLPGAGLFDLAGNGPPGGWDEHSLSMALSRSGNNDGYSSLNNMGGLTGALQNIGNPSSIGGPGGPGGKIKQIIGFAKFRTRGEALEARDALNGRKIDAERGCVLKTEMAKKNLHTKQRPVLSNTNAEGAVFGGPPAPGGGQAPPPPPPPPGGPHSAGPGGFGGMPPGLGGGPGGMGEREAPFNRGRMEGPAPSGAGGGPPGFMPGFGGTQGQAGPPPPPHANFDPFQPGGPGMVGPNGMMSPSEYGGRGPPPPGHGGGNGDFFGSRPGAQGGSGHRFAQEGSHGSEPGASRGEGKWPVSMGPLDFYDGPQNHQQQPQQGSQSRGQPSQHQQQQHQQQQQQQQSQQQQQGGLPAGTFQPGSQGSSAPRGPDWSALGSPPGLYASARPLNQEVGSQKGSSSGALSPFAEQPPSRYPGGGGSQTRGNVGGGGSQEDFGKGESTATGQLYSHQSPPKTGSETKETSGAMTRVPQGGPDAGEDNVLPRHHRDPSPGARAAQQQQQQLQPQTTSSRPHSRATSPVATAPNSSVAQRFGSLRIDSPQSQPSSNINSHQQQLSNLQQTSSSSSSHHSNNQSTLQQLQRSLSPPLLSPADGGSYSGPHWLRGQSSAHNRANSPVSPRPFSPGSESLPSPTSRSFSIDQNPPGNTLFVGNLPGSVTSPPATTQLEEALYRIFSSRKGFRQMSFRVKASGPMCFIEFDDVGCAGRALGEVNGDTLDGLVKNGGLRLSFSKNPLFRSTLNSGSNSPNIGSSNEKRFSPPQSSVRSTQRQYRRCSTHQFPFLPSQ